MIGAGPSVVHLASFTNGYPFKPEDLGALGEPVVRIRQLLDPDADVDRAVPPRRAVWIDNGDLIFSWSATLAVRIWDRGPALLNQHLFRVDVAPSVNRRWFRYVLEVGIERLKPLMHGSTMTHVTAEMLRELRTPLPSRQEQEAMAAFLDAEVAQMDALLTKKRRLVTLLQEEIDTTLLQIIVRSPLVTSDGPMRSAPTARLLSKQDRPASRDAPVITAFRDGQVTARGSRRSDGFTESWTDAAQVQGVITGDVVIHGLDGFAGAIGTSEAAGACSPVYHVCTPADGGDADFYGRLLRVLATTGYLGNFATSTRERAVDFRNWGLFGRIPLPVVDRAEQERIGERIRAVRPTKALVARSEVLLAERRQALITAAVTGQLEIPGVAA